MNIKLDYQKILGLNASVDLLSKIGDQEMGISTTTRIESDKAMKIKAQQLNKIGEAEFTGR